MKKNIILVVVAIIAALLLVGRASLHTYAAESTGVMETEAEFVLPTSEERLVIDPVRVEVVTGIALEFNPEREVIDGVLIQSNWTDIDPQYNYIAYDRETIVPGDVVMSVLFYNPEGNAEDDIIERVDWVIDHYSTEEIIDYD